MKQLLIDLFLGLILLTQCTYEKGIYVDIHGNDKSGDGSTAKPWRTLKHALRQTTSHKANIIRLSAGIFEENGQIQVPPGISIQGAGKDLTIIKGNDALYHHPDNPGYAFDKFLLRLGPSKESPEGQVLSDFSIDGDLRKLHGGILVENVSNLVLKNIIVTNTNFNGIWLINVKNSRVTGVDLINCSWSGPSWSSGALNLGFTEDVEIDNCKIEQDKGYGIKALNPDSTNSNIRLKIHDSQITVHPKDTKGTSNIAIELWNTHLEDCEIYNCYLDNDLSIVDTPKRPPGPKSIRVYNNTFDLETRAKGNGYGIELTAHHVEIDHNYFYKGRHGIVNWGPSCSDWNIHHNVFYGIKNNSYPGEIIRSQKGGLHKLRFFNNTVEFEGTKTTNLISIYGGTGDDIAIKNNLVINSNTAYNHYPNRLIMKEKGVEITNLKIENNLCFNISVPNIPGTYAGNLTVDPKIKKRGKRPAPYYEPAEGSPLINGGRNVGLPYKGASPDIGAIEVE